MQGSSICPFHFEATHCRPIGARRPNNGIRCAESATPPSDSGVLQSRAFGRKDRETQPAFTISHRPVVPTNTPVLPQEFELVSFHDDGARSSIAPEPPCPACIATWGRIWLTSSQRGRAAFDVTTSSRTSLSIAVVRRSPLPWNGMPNEGRHLARARAPTCDVGFRTGLDKHRSRHAPDGGTGNAAYHPSQRGPLASELPCLRQTTQSCLHCHHARPGHRRRVPIFRRCVSVERSPACVVCRQPPERCAIEQVQARQSLSGDLHIQRRSRRLSLRIDGQTAHGRQRAHHGIDVPAIRHRSTRIGKYEKLHVRRARRMAGQLTCRAGAPSSAFILPTPKDVPCQYDV